MAKDQRVEFVYQGEPAVLEYYDGPPRRYRCQINGGAWDRFVSNSTISNVAYNSPDGFMGYARKEALAGRDHNETTRLTQERGNAAHDQLEALASSGKGLDLSGQTEDVRGALQATAKWWLDYSPRFVSSECIVCDPGLRVAGRYDFIAEINGELVLGDLKTSEKGWQHFYKFKAEAAFAQLAGYAIALRTMHPLDPRPTARYVLHVCIDGTYDFVRDMAPHVSEESFRSKLNTYRLGSLWSKVDRDARKAEAQLGLAA